MNETRANFITKYFSQANKATRGTGIFTDTLLTQAIIESKSGASELSKKYNNFFGIKVYPAYKGKFVEMKTREETKDGQNYFVTAKFCAYNDFFDSARGYVHFLKNNSRYVKAGVFSAKNSNEQLARIAKAGYATETSYVKILQSVLDSVSSFTKKIQPKNFTIPLIGVSLVLVFLGTQKKLTNG